VRGPLPLRYRFRIERAQCDDGGMATTDELLVALDRRLLEAIESKATSDTILKLAKPGVAVEPRQSTAHRRRSPEFSAR